MKSYVEGKKDKPNEDGAVTMIAKMKPTFSKSGELYFEMVNSVPLKLCKDCEYGDVGKVDDGIVWCHKHLIHMGYDDFCSEGGSL